MDQLREEEQQQLRKEKGQFRKEKEQLRTKEQLLWARLPKKEGFVSTSGTPVMHTNA